MNSINNEATVLTEVPISLIFSASGNFEKGYTTRWTREIFVIEKVLNTNPVTYKINDLKGEEIKGSFYEQELQITEF